MTSPTPTRSPRLGWLLALLLFFLCAVILLALASRFSRGSIPFTFFDEKGVLTGPGTALLLLIAMLVALIAVIASRFYGEKWRVDLDPRRQAAFGNWLSTRVLSAPCFSRRLLRSEFLSGGALKLSASGSTDLSFRVWRVNREENIASGTAAASIFASGDPEFERLCDWQSSTPERIAPLLKLRPFTTALTLLASLAGESSSHFVVANGEAAVTLAATRVGAFDSESVQAVVAALRDLCLVARASEDGGASVLAAGVPAVAKPRGGEKKGYGCSIFIAASALLLAWFGAQFAAAKVFGLGAAMVCFFFPILILAVFTFTRPSETSTGALLWAENNVRIADVLASFPESTALIADYERSRRQN